ncbi:MAG: NUDIX domain-containing protein [Provencibacterium sp.]|jgi:8-oxo-dGTP pyrophosphatase MutT (NUDIX family)|nr:NUDIX domain-containing protein [Provencibacterium sp.]
MRLLFEMDKKDYQQGLPVFSRPSVRAIILRDGKIGMVHSLKYNYYKFPGGGMESGETREQTLIRETLEEAGLQVLPASIREYGYVHRVQKGEGEEIFVQDNYYYFCGVWPQRSAQRLDDYEAQERFTLEFIAPERAIAANRLPGHGPKDPVMIEREARVLQLLIAEGYLQADSEAL